MTAHNLLSGAVDAWHHAPSHQATHCLQRVRALEGSISVAQRNAPRLTKALLDGLRGLGHNTCPGFQLRARRRVILDDSHDQGA
jgi:hypothetical protein